MARLAQHQLTTRNIPNLEPGKSHTDGHGLMLRVQPDGRGRSWLLRVTVGGKRRVYGLGGFPDVSLREARKRAAKMRERAREGLDPVPEPEPTVTPSFAAVTDSVFRLRQQSWTPQHATQWRDSLGRHVMPAIGDKSVDVITTAEVLKLLEPLWTTKPETAGRIRQRVAMIFDFAIAAGYRTDNPCGPALLKVLPRGPRQRRHHPSLPFAEVPGVVRAIRESRARPSTRLALEFIILTGARTGEARLSTWDEIDMGAALWNVPPEHMKMRRPHRVPLSTGALDVLHHAKDLADSTNLVFPSTGRPLSKMAFMMALRRLGYPHITVHGFRASFRVWAQEETDADWATAELALAHRVGGGQIVAYARSDMLDKRRELMQAWSDFVLHEPA